MTATGLALTDADVEAYRREGYLPGRPLLSAEEAARLRADCERCCGVAETSAGGRRQASNRLRPHLLFPWAAELVRHSAILDAVERLIGPDILVFHVTVWLKEPGTENYVPWHQDATYFGLAPFEHVTAWTALTPSTPENGCVQILPGTHNDGQLGHRDERDHKAMLSRGQTLTKTLDDSAAVDLVMRPGDVSFHHTLAIHRSAPNLSDGRRIGVGVSYIPAHVRHIGDTRLSASLVRGEDRYGHFEPEPAPAAENDAAAVAAHADAINRFWVASESIPEMAHIH